MSVSEHKSVSPVAIIGCGGHARVAASALRALGREIVAFTSLRPEDESLAPGETPILTDEALIERFQPSSVELVIGFGSIAPNGQQSHLSATVRRFQDRGYRWIGLRHPFSWVAAEALLDETCQVHAGVTVQPGTAIGEFSLLNTRCSVDHDCTIARYCHIAPGAILSGGVKIGDGVHIGTGAVILQSVTIGSGAMIAAGAVVTRDVASDQWVKGVPAKSFRGKG